MAAGAGSRVDLGVETSSGEPRADPEELGVAVPNALAGFFLFAVAPLGAESSSGSLEMA